MLPKVNLLKKPQSYSIIKATEKSAAIKPLCFQVNIATFTRGALQFSQDCGAFIAYNKVRKIIIAYQNN